MRESGLEARFTALPYRAVVAAVLSLCIVPPGASGQGAPPDWKTDWEVLPGFKVEIAARGFELPSSIAMVPSPGEDPKDPLYFVTELRRGVKVVTRDGSVLPFASGWADTEPPAELPDIEGENGIAGICLAPEQGYVFVTFAGWDRESGTLRNDVMRFTVEPGTLAGEPTEQRRISTVFGLHPGDNSHQIGPCAVHRNALFVNEGDGFKAASSQQLESPLGKILRLDLDGQPLPDNPYYDGGAITPRDYVYAYGIRNAFGLEFVGDRMFVSENGLNIDRFMEIERGRNYLWAGNDWSIGLNAPLVFSPAVGPVQLRYLPPSSDVFPEEYRDRFYLALSGLSDVPGPGRAGDKSVVMIDYDMDARRVRGVAEPLIAYRGEGYQIVTGVGFSEDAMYVVPLLPDVTGESAVLRVTWDPDDAHPYIIGERLTGVRLIQEKGCAGCHEINGWGGAIGPSLTTSELVPRLTAQLSSPEYLGAIRQRLESGEQLSPVARDALTRLPELSGREQILLYMRTQILEPGFDGMGGNMPDLELTEEQAEDVAEFLLAGAEEEPAIEPGRIGELLGPARWRHVLLAFGVGGILGMVGLFILGRLWRFVRGRRASG